MTITTPCKACGELLVLERPEFDGELSDLADAIIEKIVPGVVHDRCFDGAAASIRYALESEKLAKRAQIWETLCPPLMQDTDPARLKQGPLAKLMAWDFNPQGLLINGPTGSGKSRAAWLLLKREFDVGRFICAITHTGFTSKVTTMNRDNNRDGIQWIKLLSTCDILFIDDFGKSKFVTIDGTGKIAEEILWDLMESRWTNKRPCIITTNMDGDAIQASMSIDRGAPFVRRLREFQAKISF